MAKKSTSKRRITKKPSKAPARAKNATRGKPSSFKSTKPPLRTKATRDQASSAQKSPKVTPKAREARVYEAEVLQGLTPFALQEFKRVKGAEVLTSNPSSVQFKFAGPLMILEKLKRVVAIYLLKSFNVPRPKALLGDQYFRQLTQAIDIVQTASEHDFTSFRFEAAGKTSPVFQRLAEALSKALNLPFDEENGDLMLRIKPSTTGWDVLIRLTPRPLSSRKWRTCNLPGGLNASLAVVMNDLARLMPNERYLNAMCGSGTLLIEQALANKGAQLTGVDIRQEALDCSQSNSETAELNNINLIQADATQLDFPDKYFNAITADLPWGDAVGTHKKNTNLYPAFLNEMARVSRKNARLVVLTHEIKLFDKLMQEDKHWFVKKSHQVAQSGHNPRVYLLNKKNT